jgi:hypothetical protein
VVLTGCAFPAIATIVKTARSAPKLRDQATRSFGEIQLLDGGNAACQVHFVGVFLQRTSELERCSNAAARVASI